VLSALILEVELDAVFVPIDSAEGIGEFGRDFFVVGELGSLSTELLVEFLRL
jgi:hypothetical protein